MFVLAGLMIALAVIYSFIFHLFAMPLFGNLLLHCLTLGILFGITNFSVAVLFYRRYCNLKETNNLLRNDSHKDPLTFLLNRRALDAFIQALPSEVSYSLLFIDVDNFRSFNNRYGHKVGDQVLVSVAAKIRSVVRKEDQVYRYGGEEILVVLQECNLNWASEIAERIRLLTTQADSTIHEPVSVSIGIASCPDHGVDFSAVIKAADMAMLLAKAEGKNCCRIAHNEFIAMAAHSEGSRA